MKDKKHTVEEANAWREAEDLIAAEHKFFVNYMTKGLAEYDVCTKLPDDTGSARAMSARTKWFEFISKDPRLEGWSEEFRFEVSRRYGYYTEPRLPDKPKLYRTMRLNNRSKKLTYTALREKTYAKILADVRLAITEHMRVLSDHQETDRIRDEWKKLKTQVLGATVVPPGIEVKMWIDKDAPPGESTIPAFCIKAKSAQTFGIHTARLSVEQVKRILEAINEALDVENLFVLVAHCEQHGGGVRYWTGGCWYEYNERSGYGKVYTLPEAQTAITEAQNAAGNRWASTATIVPWLSLKQDRDDSGTRYVSDENL